LLASTNENEQPSPTATVPPTEPSPSTMVEQSEVGLDWKRQLNNECGVTFFIPPAEEPYLIPRDPNTPPSPSDDEGKYWTYENYPSNLFMFNHTARVIFKNPEAIGSGYVSASVEVMCAKNTEKFNTESLLEKIKSNLLENFSVVSVASSGDGQLWDRNIKTVVFSGGSFNNDTYNAFATNTHIYLIRYTGESANATVNEVRNTIFHRLGFK
ncbi:MAG: hypothetical protein O3B87_02470, partial [bacterium]|nr:hypothetical protein [bacterium]